MADTTSFTSSHAASVKRREAEQDDTAERLEEATAEITDHHDTPVCVLRVTGLHRPGETSPTHLVPVA